MVDTSYGFLDLIFFSLNEASWISSVSQMPCYLQ